MSSKEGGIMTFGASHGNPLPRWGSAVGLQSGHRATYNGLENGSWHSNLPKVSALLGRLPNNHIGAQGAL